MDDDEIIIALVVDLLRRRGKGVYVPRRQVQLLSGWAPRPQECHLNVDTWRESYPDHEVVRGYFDFSSARRFLPHSVVKLPDRTLIDITPQQSGAGYYRFIEHIGSDELFEHVRQRYAWLQF